MSKSSFEILSSSQCELVITPAPLERKWLQNDKPIAVRQGDSKLLILGDYVSWSEHIEPFIGGLEGIIDGQLTIVANSITIDKRLVIRELHYHLVCNVLTVNKGISCLDKEKKKGDKPLLLIHTHTLEGPFEYAVLGENRTENQYQPVRIVHIVSNDNSEDLAKSFGISLDGKDSGVNCVDYVLIGEDTPNEDVTEYFVNMRRLAEWSVRRLFIANLINPNPTQSEQLKDLSMLQKLRESGVERLSKSIPGISQQLASLDSDLQKAQKIPEFYGLVGDHPMGLDNLGLYSQFADGRPIFSAEDKYWAVISNRFYNFVHEVLDPEGGLASNIIDSLDHVIRNNEIGLELKRELDINVDSLTELTEFEEKLDLEIEKIDSDISRVTYELNETTITLNDQINFDKALAERKLKERKQLQNLVKGTKLIVTVVGGIAGGWGPVVAGAMSVGIDAASAKELGDDFDFFDSVSTGVEAYEQAKKLNDSFKLVDDIYNRYKQNRAILRIKRAEHNDVEGSWIDALKLTGKGITDKEQVQLESSVEFFKGFKIESFEQDPEDQKQAGDASAHTILLLSEHASINKELLELKSKKASAIDSLLKIHKQLAEIEDPSKEIAYFNSIDFGFEEKKALLNKALDKSLISFFIEYSSTKSLVKSLGIEIEPEKESELDELAWKIGFKNYLKLVEESESAWKKEKLKEYLLEFQTSARLLQAEYDGILKDNIKHYAKNKFSIDIKIKSLVHSQHSVMGGATILSVDDSFFVNYDASEHHAAYVTEISLNGGNQNNWRLLGSPNTYIFKNGRCGLVKMTETSWYEYVADGTTFIANPEAPVRIRPMFLLSTNSDGSDLPDSVTVEGYFQ